MVVVVWSRHGSQKGREKGKARRGEARRGERREEGLGSRWWLSCGWDRGRLLLLHKSNVCTGQARPSRDGREDETWSRPDECNAKRESNSTTLVGRVGAVLRSQKWLDGLDCDGDDDDDDAPKEDRTGQERRMASSILIGNY